MRRAKDAVLRLGAAARKAARKGLLLAAAVAPLAWGVARAAGLASLSINLDVHGVSGVRDLTAASGAVSGALNLSWTEPVRNGANAPFSYQIRVSSLAQISDNNDFAAALPLSAFSLVSIPTPGLGGGGAGLAVTGLTPGVTYYFALREVDSSGSQLVGVWQRNVGKGWNVSNFAAADYGPGAPNAVSNLTAASIGTYSAPVARLTWTAPATSNGVPLARYEVRYATFSAASAGGNANTWYALARSSTSVSPAHSAGTAETADISGLPPNSPIWFAIKAIDVQSELSPVDANAASITGQAHISAVLPPQHPFGYAVSPSPTTVTISWSPTQRFGDGTSFGNPSSPTSGELSGYDIFRATSPCATFVSIATMTVSSTSYTDVTSGDNYYYDVQSFSDQAQSTGSLIVSSLGEFHLPTDDCSTELVLDPQQASSLLKSSNGLGADILLNESRRPDDVSGDILQSVQFKAMLDGKTELKSFYLSKPAVIKLHYLTQGGAPVGDTRPLGAAALQPSSGGSSAQNLGMYWFDGLEYRKLYGTVDSSAQTVTVQSPNLGVYQVRKLLRATGAVFDISNVSSRVITPNGDGLNDVLIFTFDPGPQNVVPDGRIYDLHGAFVADMTQGLVPNTLTWDGKANGRVVTSGVYVYQIKGDGKTFNGTIVVAR